MLRPSRYAFEPNFAMLVPGDSASLFGILGGDIPRRWEAMALFKDIEFPKPRTRYSTNSGGKVVQMFRAESSRPGRFPGDWEAFTWGIGLVSKGADHDAPFAPEALRSGRQMSRSPWSVAATSLRQTRRQRSQAQRPSCWSRHVVNACATRSSTSGQSPARPWRNRHTVGYDAVVSPANSQRQSGTSASSVDTAFRERPRGKRPTYRP